MSPVGPLLAPLMGIRSLRRSFRRIFGPQSQPTEGEIRSFWQLIENNGGRAVVPRILQYMNERRAQGDRWVGALQTTDVPLRLINGSFDPISGAHVADRYRELVPHADVRELAGIGHYPQVEAPEAVLDAVLDHIGAARRRVS